MPSSAAVTKKPSKSKDPNRQPKRRASKACVCCRARKVRCNVVEHGAPCTNCRLDEFECVVTEGKRKRKYPIILPSPTDTTSGTPPLPESSAPLPSVECRNEDALSHFDFDFHEHVPHHLYKTLNDEIMLGHPLPGMPRPSTASPTATTTMTTTNTTNTTNPSTTSSSSSSSSLLDQFTNISRSLLTDDLRRVVRPSRLLELESALSTYIASLADLSPATQRHCLPELYCYFRAIARARNAILTAERSLSLIEANLRVVPDVGDVAGLNGAMAMAMAGAAVRPRATTINTTITTSSSSTSTANNSSTNAAVAAATGDARNAQLLGPKSIMMPHHQSVSSRSSSAAADTAAWERGAAQSLKGFLSDASSTSSSSSSFSSARPSSSRHQQSRQHHGHAHDDGKVAAFDLSGSVSGSAAGGGFCGGGGMASPGLSEDSLQSNSSSSGGVFTPGNDDLEMDLDMDVRDFFHDHHHDHDDDVVVGGEDEGIVGGGMAALMMRRRSCEVEGGVGVEGFGSSHPLDMGLQMDEGMLFY